MITIEIRGGCNKVFKKNVNIFKMLCKRWEIQELIVGKMFKGDIYVYAVSPMMIIGLYAGREAYDLILEDLRKEFKILECESSSFHAGIRENFVLVEDKLSDIEDIIKKRNLVECPTCKRSTDEANFCPYCGKKLDIHAKLCEVCQMVYVPSYSYCPTCGTGLKETPHEIFDFLRPKEFFWGVDKICIREADSEKDT